MEDQKGRFLYNELHYLGLNSEFLEAGRGVSP